MIGLRSKNEKKFLRGNGEMFWLLSAFFGVLFLCGCSAKTQTVFCTISQITNTTWGYGGHVPSINSDGTRIAFTSDRDITGGNPDINGEIFLFDTNTMTFSQITNTMGSGKGNPSINSDGTRIAFDTGDNITGGNPDGNGEIFLFDTNTMLFTQITNTPGPGGGSQLASINSDGTRIAFMSNRDITGGNPDLNHEIFLFDTNTMMFTQITNTTLGLNQFPSINSDGTRIAFRSDRDITGGNPDLSNEIFLFDTDTMTFTEITHTALHANQFPSINSDGTRIAFMSPLNITGGNPDGNREIFLADYPENCIQSPVPDKLEFLKNFVAICPFCPPDPEEKLLEKIQLAIKEVQKNNIRPAINAMRYVEKKTGQFMESGEIPRDIGQRIIDMAEDIITDLEGLMD